MMKIYSRLQTGADLFCCVIMSQIFFVFVIINGSKHV